MGTITRMSLTVGCGWGIPLCARVLMSFVSTTSAVGELVLLANMITAVTYLLAAAIAIPIAVTFAWSRRWGAALSSALIPAPILCFCLWPSSLQSFARAGDYVRFVATSAQYSAAIEAMPRTGLPRFQWFFWRDASAPLNGETLVFLVYDESDELARPNTERTAAWQDRAHATFMAATGYMSGPTMPDDPLHMSGHYYVVYVDY